MTSIFKKAILGTALAATAIAAVPTAASADEWHHHGGNGAGIAIAAGVIGLIAGAAIASDHHDRYYAPEPVAYPVEPACYQAYPGYDGYCYPSSYYVNLGWGYHDGGWWYGGSRYARPYVIGGYRGGYNGGGWGGGYRGGYTGGGYTGGGYHGGNGGYRGNGGGWNGGGDHGWHGGNGGGDHGWHGGR